MSSENAADTRQAVGSVASGTNAAWPRIVLVLWIGQFLVTLGLTVVVPLLPIYLEELGCRDPEDNRFWTSWSLAAPAIPLMVMAPLWGRLGDRFGRKAMVVRALFGIAVSVMAMAWARSPLAFFFCRLAQGAFGGVDDAAGAFASTEVPVQHRGRAIGLLQTGTAAGALLGPLAGGFLSRDWGFGPLLLATGACIACAGLIAARMLPSGGHETDGSKRTAPPPMRQALRALHGDRAVCSFLLAGFLVQFGGYGMVALFAARVRSMVDDLDAAARWVGALQAVTWAVTLLGASYWGRLNDRRSVEKNFAWAAAACSLSVAGQAIPSQPIWLLPLRVVQGFTNSALGQSVFLRVTRGVAPAERGLRIGIANSGLTLGHVVGSLAVAALAPWLSTAALFLLMATAFLLAAGTVALGAGPNPRSPLRVRPTSL